MTLTFQSGLGLKHATIAKGNIVITAASEGGADDDTYWVDCVGKMVVAEICGNGINAVSAEANSFSLASDVESWIVSGKGNLSGSDDMPACNGSTDAVCGGCVADLLLHNSVMTTRTASLFMRMWVALLRGV